MGIAWKGKEAERDATMRAGGAAGLVAMEYG